MNNNQNIIIKSLPQPDGGEGASEWQGMDGNVHAEESHSKNAGRCTRIKLGGPLFGTSLQHKTKSSIYRITKEHRLDVRAWKVRRITSGEPRRVWEQSRTGTPAREFDRVEAVSRGRSSCMNRAGVAADGSPVQRMNRRSQMQRRSERCWSRMVPVNESGK
jgi:hypothetical protein